MIISGERELTHSKKNRNKFETNKVSFFSFQLKLDLNMIHRFNLFQEDVFEVKAVELGKLRKIKIRHDNKGVRKASSFFLHWRNDRCSFPKIGAAWFLDRVEIVDPSKDQTYVFVLLWELSVNESFCSGITSCAENGLLKTKMMEWSRGKSQRKKMTPSVWPLHVKRNAGQSQTSVSNGKVSLVNDSICIYHR